MKLSEQVIKSIKEYNSRDFDSALLHACISIDATARAFFGKGSIGKAEYKALIKEYLWIIEPIMGSGVNLGKTVWENVEIDNGYGKIISAPTFEDIIYHIFRCSHAHGKEVPKNYELLEPEDGKLRWEVGGGTIRMPKLIIPALLAVSILSKINAGVITFGDDFFPVGHEQFVIKDWWGKEEDLKLFLANKIPNPTRVDLSGLSNLNPLSKGFSIMIIPPTWS